ncbi:hypothetical protein KOW79_004627 [Hemibagrus wyckioides]|uniref:Uncharacterized protein n=1 Tax=Hemibagrus wyckioides TaxID=337641 RepID=A0A9D3SVI4_9TELE|nr:hypothetical protein KOW79_004627 [Hemibagrus wyckioides]
MWLLKGDAGGLDADWDNAFRLQASALQPYQRWKRKSEVQAVEWLRHGREWSHCISGSWRMEIRELTPGCWFTLPFQSHVSSSATWASSGSDPGS